jgi:hypothetical protein
MDKAIVLAAEEIARRLEVLNHFHQLAREKERDFVLREETQMTTLLQDIIDDVAAEKTVIDSLTVFVHGLEDQIKTLPGITPAQQAQIDHIFADVEKNKAAITAAMAHPPV